MSNWKWLSLMFGTVLIVAGSGTTPAAQSAGSRRRHPGQRQVRRRRADGRRDRLGARVGQELYHVGVHRPAGQLRVPVA